MASIDDKIKALEQWKEQYPGTNFQNKAQTFAYYKELTQSIEKSEELIQKYASLKKDCYYYIDKRNKIGKLTKEQQERFEGLQGNIEKEEDKVEARKNANEIAENKNVQKKSEQAKQNEEAKKQLKESLKEDLQKQEERKLKEDSKKQDDRKQIEELNKLLAEIQKLDKEIVDTSKRLEQERETNSKLERFKTKSTEKEETKEI